MRSSEREKRTKTASGTSARPSPRKDDKKVLTNQEKLFVAEYLVSLNPREAAEKAGYSLSLAKSKAYQWVSNRKVKPHVHDAIQERLRERVQELGLDADRALRQAAMQTYLDVRALFHSDGRPKQMHELDAVTAQAVQVEITNKQDEEPIVKIRNPERSQSLEKLARHHRLYESDNKPTGGEIAKLLEEIAGSASVIDQARKRSGIKNRTDR